MFFLWLMACAQVVDRGPAVSAPSGVLLDTAGLEPTRVFATHVVAPQSPAVLTGSGIEVTSSGPIRCAKPQLRREKHFDVHAKPYDDDRDWIRMWGAGVAAADFDGDARTDVIFLGGRASQFFRQDPEGRFIDDSASALDSREPLDEVFGGSVADYDADGDLDLYVTRYNEPNVLLRNDGSGRFQDVTANVGLALGSHRSGASAWADVDRDGDLDLFVSGHGRIIEDGSRAHDFPPGEPSYLFLNTGAGFVDRSDLLPPEIHDGYTFVGGWHDIDEDGWPDLWAINDIGGAQRPCTLAMNRGGAFEPDHNMAGLDLAVSGMGLGVGDVNGDGLDDFAVPAWNEVRFMLSSSAGLWIDHSRTLGVRGDPLVDQVVGWAAELADMDNDTDLDIPMAFGFIDTQLADNAVGQPDALFIQDADGSFTDRAEEWGVADRGYARGLALADLNNDGWLDVAKPDINGPRLLQVSRCGEESWLRVGLRSEGPNTHAIGAKIVVETEATSQYRKLYAGSTGYGSSGPPEAHFGLGAAESVSRVVVYWPDGVVSELRDVEARQILTIRRM